MQKKAIMLSLAAVSAAAIATSLPPIEIKQSASHVGGVVAATQAAAPAAQAVPAVAPIPSQIANAVARWRSLSQSDNLPFGAYASFLAQYRGWPGESAMRRAAENAITDTSPAGEVAAYFRIMPPMTAIGEARLAFALQATGRQQEAVEAARRAWQGGALPQPVEDRLLASFSASFGASDHEKRLDALLDNGQVAAAQRTIAFTAGARRPVHEARIALQANASDANDRVNALGAAVTSDAGLLMDRANWLRNNNQPQQARQLLGTPRTLTQRPADAEKFLETMLNMARGAANDGQWDTAYRIASQLDDVFPPGTDVGVQDYGERDDYTSLAWLAGTTALHRLGRPADAIGMFDRYAQAARSPQTVAKGHYWAGRAAAAAGQAERANAYFAQAAVHPDQFYGQLAMERLGRSIAPPAAVPLTAPTPAARSAFSSSQLVQAVRYLGQIGQRDDQSLFIRALADSLHKGEDRVLAGELAREIGRPDLGVWVARQARNDGVTHYSRPSFPEVPIPGAYAHQWTINHAIMRQESSFDRTAQSHVGARGMMQLMPGTARDTARKLGLSYDQSRLTADPQYNIMLGSKYFADMMESFGNSAPLAVAAYNAGPGNVRKWIRNNGDPRLPGADMVRWIEDIPFFETRNYVQRVLENAVVYDTINPHTRVPAQNRLSYYLGKPTRPG